MNTSILRRKMALPTILVAGLTLTACDVDPPTGPNRPAEQNTGITANAEATPSSGGAPLAVRLTGSSNGNVVLYEWDFDGNGTYDWSSPLSGDTDHIYDEPGFYVATLRVTDATGASDTASVGICATEDALFCD